MFHGIGCLQEASSRMIDRQPRLIRFAVPVRLCLRMTVSCQYAHLLSGFNGNA